MNIIRIQGQLEYSRGILYEYDADSIPIGEGGMGKIFHGYRVDTLTGARDSVAIKVIHDNIASQPQIIERAYRESMVQIDHDNLLRMYGFIQTLEQNPMTGGQIIRNYMIMERLVGVNLDHVMEGTITDKSGLVVPFAQQTGDAWANDKSKVAVEIMTGLLKGLQALHSAGYIHRDIDPSNVMLTFDEKIKLIDYGICKQISNPTTQNKSLTQAGTFMGKVKYAAPELILGDLVNQNATTDLYACGILLFQLLTGHLPFEGSDSEIMAHHMRDPLPLDEIQDKKLRSIVEKATFKEQNRRYQSASEFLADLGGVDHAVEPKGSNGGKVEKSDSGDKGGVKVEAQIIPYPKVTLFAGIALAAGILLGLVFKLIIG